MSVADHEVRLGDCVAGMAALNDKSIDVVLTDPPYSERTHTNSVRGRGHQPGGKLIDLGFEHMTPEKAWEVAAHFGRLARRWVIVFSDMESGHTWRAAFVAAGLECTRTGVWVKECPTPQMTGDRPAIGTELVNIAHPPGRKRWNGGGKPAVWTCPTAYRDGDLIMHTTQKPLRLMQALVRDFTDPGDLVLDPFAGSGTTGVAARTLGRRFLGFEMDANHARDAGTRIAAAREQFNIFRERPAEPKQAALFALGAGVGEGERRNG